MTIKQKLTLGIGSIVAIATISSAIITFNLNSIHTTSEQTAVESVPFSIAAADAKYQSCQVQQFVTDASLTHDNEVMKEAENALKLLRYDFEKFEEMYKREGDTKAIRELEKMEAAAVEMFQTGQRMKDAYAISKADGDKVMEELDQDTEVLAKLIDTLQKSQVQEAVDNSNSVMNQASSTLMISIILAILVLVIGIVVGSILTNQITSSLEKFQIGLLSFFSFLNKKTNHVESITIDGDDEFARMATVVNENIINSQSLIQQDESVIADVKRVVALVKDGKIKQQIHASTNNAGLEELKTIFNEMLNVMAANVCGDINKVQAALEAYRKLDFTHRISDPTGQTSQGLNALAEIINEMLANGLRNGIELQGDASSLKQAVESLSTASNQQAASLEETAAAMEEMTSNVQQNAQKANDMASMAAQTDASAKEGAELAQRTATAMTEIQVATNSINNAVAIIENIAFQTNILSLNAAVEAATAGDAGKGFAVVAQEVRNLANRSADAAKEIKAMAEQAATKSNEGMSIATELTRGFEVIAGKIEQTTMLVQDVSNASREQMQGIGQINTAVTQLDQMTQENAKIAAEADAIANATIDKASAMVADASSKNFVGKNEIQAQVNTHKTLTHKPTTRPMTKPSATLSPRPASPAPKPSIKSSNDDVWESF